MRKIVMWNLITVDGLFEGPGRDLGWFCFDEELETYMKDTQDEADTLLFGRITYEMMAAYWPTAEGWIADYMNSVPKVVCSKTLDRADWSNSRLIKDNIPDELSKLKSRKGKDIRLIGSADLASTLVEHDLIDEYRLAINPLILGRGTPLFKAGAKRLDLNLRLAKPLGSGMVILHYERNR